MSELPSRGERFINHMIDYRNKKMSELASMGDWESPYLKDALFYDKLATDPDLFESLEECEDRGITFTGTIYTYEEPKRIQGPTFHYGTDGWDVEQGYDNPIGKLP